MKRFGQLLGFAVIFLFYITSVNAIPNVSNVRVLPEIPNAGQDLLCNYTYSSPENYTEQNSTFEWWENSINQNVNSQILAKSNLSVGDSWYCKVTGFDGLNFSTAVQSSNMVVISNATLNPTMYLNDSISWNQTGYFGESSNILDFTAELNNALENCTADSQGFCTIPIKVSSDSVGVLNASDLGIYYTENRATVVSLEIQSINEIYTNGTLKMFEFVIHNDGDTTVTDIQWQFDTNDSYVISSTSNITSLITGERTFVYVQYNFSEEGTFNVNASATGLTVSTSLTADINVGDLIITGFTTLNIQNTNAIFEIIGRNNLNENISNLNWSLDTGDTSKIYSTINFNLSPNKTIFIYAAYGYSSKNTYTALANLSNGSLEITKTVNVTVEDLDLKNLSVFDGNLTKRIFELVLENTLALNLTNVNWTFDTKNNTIINSTSSVILQPNEKMFVYIDYNFTGAGAFNVNATARNGTLTDSRNLTVTI